MGVFYREEEELPSYKRKCSFLASALKDVFCNCHTFHGKISSSSPGEDDDSISDFEEEQEIVISIIRSRAMDAQSRPRKGFLLEDYSWVFSPSTRQLFVSAAAKTEQETEENHEDGEDDGDDFCSVGSCLSHWSRATNAEEFLSAKTSFSLCSSPNRLDFRRSIVYEFCHCEGWPFGLCRKALLLPPLPQSPSESWLSLKKGAKVATIP